MTAAHENFAQWCSDELARVEAALNQWIVADAPANLGDEVKNWGNVFKVTGVKVNQ